MQFSAAAIQQRLVTYTWCYGDAAWRLYRFKIIGDVAKQQEERNRMVLIDKALDVLCSYQTGDAPCCSQSASTYEEVCCMIGLVDPCCVSCGCPPGGPPENECTPSLFATVISAVDVGARASIEAGPPNEGDSYLIVSGTTDGTWSVNSIATWTSGAWVSVFLINGRNVIASDTGTYWTTKNNATPGHLFPAVTATYVGGLPPTYNLQSDYPSISLASNRIIQVEIRGLTGGWFLAYQGAESTIGTPYSFNVGGLDMQTIRVTYFDGLCRTTVGGVTMPPPGGCGVLVSVVTASCNGDDFNVSVYIQSAAGFILGNIVATPEIGFPVTVPAVLGTTILGPFDRLDTVSVVITNSFDSECNYDAGVFSHPSYPLVDYPVIAAVDASFASSYVSGSYLVVSNTGAISNAWSTHIGEIWNGTTWTVPQQGEVVRAQTGPVLDSYWQMDGGVPVQVFAPMVIEYGSFTGEWIAYPPVFAPFVAGENVLATYACSSVLTPIYAGISSGFLETPLASVCETENMVGSLRYIFQCDVTIPAIVRETEPFPEVGLNFIVNHALLQSDGKIVCLGSFSLYDNSIPATRVTRLNNDGTLDTAFNTAIGTGPNAAVRWGVLDSVGRIIIGGDFTSFNGNTSYPFLVRLLPNGTIDTSFVVGTSLNSNVGIVLLQPSDGILVLGNFTVYDGVGANRIIRLNANGSRDVSFDMGTGFNSFANGGAVGINADRTILIGSAFGWTSYDGNVVLVDNVNEKGVVRVNPDGSFHSSFTIGTHFNESIHSLWIQDDGKVLFTGAFTSYNGTAVPRIARLNADGTLDTTFNAGVGVGFSLSTTAVIELPNGQILVGNGDMFQGMSTNRLTRLNADGTKDPTFNIGLGFDNSIERIIMEDIDTVIVCGGFSTFNAVNRYRVMRLNM